MSRSPKNLPPGSFTARPRRPSPAEAAANAATLFDEEIAKVVARLEAVASSDRVDFSDGSAGYDHACLAVLRLAAMLEDASPFAPRFASLDDETRRGIITTRNIISHIGYGSMDDEVFWHTVTVDIPVVLHKLGLA